MTRLILTNQRFCTDPPPRNDHWCYIAITLIDGRIQIIKSEWRVQVGSATGATGMSVLPVKPKLRISRFSNPGGQVFELRDTLLAMDRRTFVWGVTATAATLSTPQFSTAASSDLDPVFKEVEKRHDEAVQRLQTWIRQPSIAAENREVDKGCELTMQMLRDAGFQSVSKVPTDGQPGIFATLDAGAPKTLGVYFMYDVKQVNPAEWSSPPWDAALVDKPGVGKVVVGRGAVNQKGPEATFLAAIHAIRGAGRKMPVNLVLVAEGEEEIGSPHFPQIVRRPEVIAALKN